MYKQNLHTHSLYCDGKDPLEKMILLAMEKGYDSIGFSGHSYTPFDETYCMSKEATEKYYLECRKLQKKYKGKIEVLCGIEQDFYAPAPEFDYDYIIGSVHYVKCGEEYVSVDYKPEILVNAAEKYFNGDIYAIAELYYANVENVVKTTNCDIIGHFDVISKFIETNEGIIDVGCERYRRAGEKAIKKLAGYEKIFEMNAGAMSNGRRSSPYPARNFLSLIQKLGGKVIFSSDCHDKNKLDCGREDMKRLATETGFSKYSVLKNGTFSEEPII